MTFGIKIPTIAGVVLAAIHCIACERQNVRDLYSNPNALLQRTDSGFVDSMDDGPECIVIHLNGGVDGLRQNVDSGFVDSVSHRAEGFMPFDTCYIVMGFTPFDTILSNLEIIK